MESFVFDFSKPKNFLRFLNIYYKISDMNGALNFEFVLASYSDDNINNCLNEDNTINEDVVTIYQVTDGGLSYSEDEYGSSLIKTSSPIEFNIGNDIVPLKAVFIRDKQSKVVFLYCINMTAFTVTNSFIIDEDVFLFTDTDGEYRL